jgi:CheY-like chemotaxis protein
VPETFSQECVCAVPSQTLVWIDDYEPGLAMYKRLYEKLGYHIRTASNGHDGLKILSAFGADAVIVDYEMPEMDGGILTQSIKKLWPTLPVIMFSACVTVPRHITHLLDAFCDKADGRECLHLAIRKVLEKRHSLSATSSIGIQPGRLAAM